MTRPGDGCPTATLISWAGHRGQPAQPRRRQLAAVNLRVMGDEPDRRFDDQLAAMIQAREDGLIGGVGLSNVSLERLRRALERTSIACVQNPLNLADRSSMPVLQECAMRGIAFVPLFPLGSAFAPDNPVLGNPGVRAIAERLGATPAQVALAWTLGLAPNVLLIPGTSSVAHLEENLAAADVGISAMRHSAAISALGERIALAVARRGPATPSRA